MKQKHLSGSTLVTAAFLTVFIGVLGVVFLSIVAASAIIKSENKTQAQVQATSVTAQ